ncbi:Aspartic proteinase PCS1 [Linum grandiflorum]
MASSIILQLHPFILLLISLLSNHHLCLASTRQPPPHQIFPLKTQTHQRVPNSRLFGSLAANSKADKMLFHHNVSLTVSLTVGSPPQNVTMVLDTGSELSWLHCRKTPDFSSVFDPLSSKSYVKVPCGSSTCRTRTRDLSIPVSCDSAKLCHVIVSYADATSIEGTLAAETFRIGSMSRQGTLFGCMDSGFSSNLEEDAKSTGLLGMNRGSLSFINQMGYPKFSYCISSIDSSGVLLLGDAKFSWLKPLKYTPMVLSNDPLPYFDRVAYTVQLEGIKVNNKLLPLPKSAFQPDHTGAGQTMVDSGTQFSFLMGPVYTALRAEFLSQTAGKLKVLDDPNYVFQGSMDLCYLIDSNQKVVPPGVPTVTMMFRGAEMSLAGDKLLYRVAGETRGKNSVWCFTFGNSELLGIESFLIGHHHQQNVWMEYDIANSRIGLAEVKCDDARQQLGLHA